MDGALIMAYTEGNNGLTERKQGISVSVGLDQSFLKKWMFGWGSSLRGVCGELQAWVGLEKVYRWRKFTLKA